MREEVEKVLAEEVRPMLSMHGGGVDLVEVTEDGIVKVRLTGGCGGCPSAQMTLTGVVESAIKAKVPEIKKVE
ncbi:MAG: NifU family protein, partial [Candidatus Omnitrophica bacterium]|nr:NifU family protein [Candidatus Omnitrophota bacterium]